METLLAFITPFLSSLSHYLCSLFVFSSLSLLFFYQLMLLSLLSFLLLLDVFLLLHGFGEFLSLLERFHKLGKILKKAHSFTISFATVEREREHERAKRKMSRRNSRRGGKKKCNLRFCRRGDQKKEEKRNERRKKKSKRDKKTKRENFFSFSRYRLVKKLANVWSELSGRSLDVNANERIWRRKEKRQEKKSTKKKKKTKSSKILTSLFGFFFFLQRIGLRCQVCSRFLWIASFKGKHKVLFRRDLNFFFSRTCFAISFVSSLFTNNASSVQLFLIASFTAWLGQWWLSPKKCTALLTSSNRCDSFRSSRPASSRHSVIA